MVIMFKIGFYINYVVCKVKWILGSPNTPKCFILTMWYVKNNQDGVIDET